MWDCKESFKLHNIICITHFLCSPRYIKAQPFVSLMWRETEIVNETVSKVYPPPAYLNLRYSFSEMLSLEPKLSGKENNVHTCGTLNFSNSFSLFI